MANPSIDGVVYQVRLKWLLHGQVCYNVLHFRGRGVQDLIDNLLTPVINCVVENLLPVLSHDIKLTSADVNSITGSVAQEAEVPNILDNVGTLSTDSLPSTNTAVFAFKTGHPGRTGRGRMAVPGIAEETSAQSQVDGAFIVAAAAFLACMAAAFINSDPLSTPFFHWAVWSRKDSQAYEITSTAVRPIIGTMRSRKVH